MNVCILGPVWYIQFPKCLKFNMLQTKHLVLPSNILFRHFWAQYMTSQFPRLKKYIGIMLSPISLIPQILSPNLVIFTKKNLLKFTHFFSTWDHQYLVPNNICCARATSEAPKLYTEAPIPSIPHQQPKRDL